jgi:hypothetical protein
MRLFGLLEVAASPSLMAVDRAGVGQGRMTVGARQFRRDPDFWCAFKGGEERAIGDAP